MSLPERFSRELNPPQRDAVNSLDGPLLILAGAGSGKTRVLTYRIAHLILSQAASPSEILAVTFTNKAAREMESRVRALLEELQIPLRPNELWVTTFHSGCARILRSHIELLGYQPFFVIYDEGDQLSMIKKVLDRLNIDDKIHPAKNFRSRINEAKMWGLAPDDVAQRLPLLMKEQEIQVYRLYEEEMKRANALDFGDLLLKTYDLFLNYPAILEAYQRKFRYLLVDEYQDTNRIQYLLIKLLTSQHQNICVVGDEDQSIYSWRGADISNILSFEADYPSCRVIKLEENYRSSATIVEAASHLIKNNTQRKEKTLFTNNPAGEKIVVRETMDEYDEARYVVQKILVLSRDQGLRLRDFAVFYRTNAQSRVLEEQLRSHGLAYRLIGSVKFYERQEVKDMIAYLRLLLNPADDMALKRIINVPARGIGKTSVTRLEEFAGARQIPLFEAIARANEVEGFHSGIRRKLLDLSALLNDLRARAKSLPPSGAYLAVLDEIQYVQRLREEKTSEASARIENLEELHNAILQFERERGEDASLQTYLEEMALVSDSDELDERQEAVTLMTLHISKGLEFPVVFIVGLEEGLFPSGRALNDASSGGLEEERRLAYVGMTRARRMLFLSHARLRRIWGQEQQHPPSQFLSEIPDRYVHATTALGRPRPVKVASTNGTAAPSWRQAASGTGLPAYEDFSQETPATGDGSSSFAKGMRVRHPIFGIGSIFKVEGQGVDQKVSVIFGDQSTKKFVARYARLERV